MCHRKLENFKEAHRIYLEIADMLLTEGYEEEAEMAKEEAKRLQLKMK